MSKCNLNKLLNYNTSRFVFTAVLCFYLMMGLYSQSDTVAGIPVNYDEAKVQPYTLPSALTFTNGDSVLNAEMWIQGRRQEIINLFEQNQFGRFETLPVDANYDVFESGTLTADGKAIRKQVNINLSTTKGKINFDVLLYLPSNHQGKVPLMLMVNFTANSTMTEDPNVRKGMVWNRDKQQEPAPEKSRFGGFDYNQFLEAGIGIAMVYYGDIEPDFDGGRKLGIRRLFGEIAEERPSSDGGAIASWAWGLSRIMDYLQTDKDVDVSRIALYGV